METTFFYMDDWMQLDDLGNLHGHESNESSACFLWPRKHETVCDMSSPWLPPNLGTDGAGYEPKVYMGLLNWLWVPNQVPCGPLKRDG